jgi:hypothetical protein
MRVAVPNTRRPMGGGLEHDERVAEQGERVRAGRTGNRSEQVTARHPIHRLRACLTASPLRGRDHEQLLAGGETVLDLQPKLGSRVRLLSSGSSNKTDPNHARSVAIAALRSPVRTAVAADDHAMVLTMWSKRHRDLSRLRCQAACRLHASLCEFLSDDA